MNRLITDLKVLENRFYSSFFTEAGMKPGTYSESDVDILSLAEHPVAVNPKRRLEAIALERGWEIQEWK